MGEYEINKLAYPLIFNISLYLLANDLNTLKVYDSEQLGSQLVYSLVVLLQTIDLTHISFEKEIYLALIWLP